MAIISHSSIKNFFSYTGSFGLLDMFEKKLKQASIDSINSVSIQLMMEFLIYSYHSLKNVFQQLNELMLWGDITLKK